MQFLVSAGLVVMFIVLSKYKVVEARNCEAGHGYPDVCPQPGEALNLTRCCKYYLTPACCEERASTGCVWSGSSSRTGRNVEPGESDYAVFCPQPGQSGDKTVCCSNSSGFHCCSTKLLAGILGGVVGGLALIGVIIGVVCYMQIHSGRWQCVQSRPGKWTVVSRAHAEKINSQRQMDSQANRVRSRCQRTCPYDRRECTVPEETAQRCCGDQCPHRGAVVPGKAVPHRSEAPPSYPEVVSHGGAYSNFAYGSEPGAQKH